jgi:hypothetical protein
MGRGGAPGRVGGAYAEVDTAGATAPSPKTWSVLGER